MIIEIIQPCEELKGYIEHFWVGRWEGCGKEHFTYYATANIQTELVFAYTIHPVYGPELVFSSVQGHTDSFGQYPVSGVNELFGVSLYAHAIPYLFDISASELNNQLVYFDALLEGQPDRGVNEKMAMATTVQQRVAVLTDYFKLQLRDKYTKDPVMSGAIQYIKQHKGMVNIRELASEFCLSQKQFERRFKSFTSFTPKLYSRVTRFDAAFMACLSNGSLAEVAYTHGYYDQAHFIHEFKKFSGFSPQKYFSLADY
ncbi:AraC family transcriptional regulator [Rapidithrix thailandica]|uniref:AraC family transcriptional regulator n=1 Tax=Rapidithrix thailandica TaxID=413964 RepID=A0AAW9S947_9BACT